jgi:large subunit ribosomal protein L21e
MPHSYGYRSRTRDLFQRDFRKHGTIQTGTYMKVYKVGQVVDIKANGAVHKGMPHKFYHGKTGVVWNVTKRAIGVEVNKLVGNRIIPKRIHVRVEHANHSKCRTAFLERAASNDAIRKAHKEACATAAKNKTAAPAPYNVKRTMPGPRPAMFIKKPKVVSLTAKAFIGLYQ